MIIRPHDDLKGLNRESGTSPPAAMTQENDPENHAAISARPASRGMAVGASGLRVVPGYLDRVAQEELLAALRGVLRRAPAYTPRMPKSGRPLSVRMTNCGPLGWMTDAGGYRYQPLHPDTGAPWPTIPDILLA